MKNRTLAISDRGGRRKSKKSLLVAVLFTFILSVGILAYQFDIFRITGFATGAETEYEAQSANTANTSSTSNDWLKSRNFSNVSILDNTLRLTDFNDSFDANIYDGERWSNNSLGANSTVEVVNNYMNLTANFNSSGADARMKNFVPVTGNFNLTMDYDTLGHPVETGISEIMFRIFWKGIGGTDIDEAWVWVTNSSVSESTAFEVSFRTNGTRLDTSVYPSGTFTTPIGKMRWTREDGNVTAWNGTVFDGKENWTKLLSNDSFNTSWIQFEIRISATQAQKSEMHFDNFSLNYSNYLANGTWFLDYDSGQVSNWSNFTANASQTSGGNVSFRFKGADTQTDLETASWTDYYKNTSDKIDFGREFRWLRAELTLNTTNTTESEGWVIGLSTPIVYNFTVEAVDRPPWVIKWVAVDNDTNPTFRTNNTAPTINITTNENADCKINSVTHEFANGTNKCTGNGTKYHLCEMPTLSGDGMKSAFVTCNDTFGNADNKSQYDLLNFTLDTTAPSITVNSPSGDFLGKPVVFNVTVNEPARACWYSLDKGVANTTMNLSQTNASDIWTRYTIDSNTSSAHRRRLAVGDVDNDGLNEVVIKSPTGWLYVYNGSGSTWTQNTIDTSGSGNLGLAIGDIDDDGYNELIIGFDEAVIMYNGSGSIWSNTTIVENVTAFNLKANRTDGANGLAIGDADNDGDNEIVIGTYSVASNHSVIIIDGSGTSWSNNTIDNNTHIRVEDLLIADADNDGDNEIVIITSATTDARLIVYNGSGSGWTKTQITKNFGNFYSLAVGDADDNNLNEIAVGSIGDISSNISVYNGSDSTWTSNIIAPNLTDKSRLNDVRSLAIGDADNDGDNEVVAAVRHSMDLLFDGSGSSWTNYTIDATTSDYPHTVVISDADNDGLNDIVIMSNATYIYTGSTTEWNATEDLNDQSYTTTVYCNDTFGYETSANSTFNVNPSSPPEQKIRREEPPPTPPPTSPPPTSPPATKKVKVKEGTIAITEKTIFSRLSADFLSRLGLNYLSRSPFQSALANLIKASQERQQPNIEIKVDKKTKTAEIKILDNIDTALLRFAQIPVKKELKKEELSKKIKERIKARINLEVKKELKERKKKLVEEELKKLLEEKKEELKEKIGEKKEKARERLENKKKELREKAKKRIEELTLQLEQEIEETVRRRINTTELEQEMNISINVVGYEPRIEITIEPIINTEKITIKREPLFNGLISFADNFFDSRTTGIPALLVLYLFAIYLLLKGKRLKKFWLIELRSIKLEGLREIIGLKKRKIEEATKGKLQASPKFPEPAPSEYIGEKPYEPVKKGKVKILYKKPQEKEDKELIDLKNLFGALEHEKYEPKIDYQPLAGKKTNLIFKEPAKREQEEKVELQELLKITQSVKKYKPVLEYRPSEERKTKLVFRKLVTKAVEHPIMLDKKRLNDLRLLLKRAKMNEPKAKIRGKKK